MIVYQEVGGLHKLVGWSVLLKLKYLCCVLGGEVGVQVEAVAALIIRIKISIARVLFVDDVDDIFSVITRIFSLFYFLTSEPLGLSIVLSKRDFWEATLRICFLSVPSLLPFQLSLLLS